MKSTLTAPLVNRFAATQATTMQAIVQDAYGSPDVLKLVEVAKPELKIALVAVCRRCKPRKAATKPPPIQIRRFLDGAAASSE